jgi:hypothetical protein
MDTTTLLIIVGIVLLVMFLLNRSRYNAGGTPYGPFNRGDERPRYDDPDYTSAGSIGGGAVDNQPRYDDPNYTSAGSIGGGEPPLRERSVGEAPPPTPERERPSHDDPNYRSGGSIGG